MAVGSTQIRAVALVIAVAGATAAGCGGQIKLRKADVEMQAKRAVGHLLGHAPDGVICPDDMTATVGESMRCVVDAHRSRSAVTVTITSVDPQRQNAKFDVTLETSPTSTHRPPQAATSDGPGKWQAT